MSKDDYIWKNPAELLKILITLAPDINVRVGLLEVVDYILGFEDGDVVDTDDILEVVAQAVSMLHHHVGDDSTCDDEEMTEGTATVTQQDDFSGMSADEIIEAFRKQMDKKKDGK